MNELLQWKVRFANATYQVARFTRELEIAKQALEKIARDEAEKQFASPERDRTTQDAGSTTKGER